MTSRRRSAPASSRPGPIVVRDRHRRGGRRGRAARRCSIAPPPSRWSRPTRIRPGAFFVENPGWLSGGAVRWAVAPARARPATPSSTRSPRRAPPGAGGVTFIPALAGAMTPVWRPHARGTLHGLAAAHDRAHVARAVLEGLAFAARDVVERLVALGLPARERAAARRRRAQRGVGAAPRRRARPAARRRGAHGHVPDRRRDDRRGRRGRAPDLAAAAALAPPPARDVSSTDAAIAAARRRLRALPAARRPARAAGALALGAPRARSDALWARHFPPRDLG